MARWVCRASAVMTAWAMSTPSSRVASMGISLVFAPTSVWARTSPCWWVITASRRTWLPSESRAPRTALPSTASTTGSATPVAVSAGLDVVGLSGFALLWVGARSASQAPIAASTAAASTSVSTRQIVALDGGAGTGTVGAGSHRAYTEASRSAGVSVTHPAIAVNERIPATTAPAHKASTTATGCVTHCARRGSLTCAKRSSRSRVTEGTAASHEDRAEQAGSSSRAMADWDNEAPVVARDL